MGFEKYGNSRESKPNLEQVNKESMRLAASFIPAILAQRSIETPPGGGEPLADEELSKKIESGQDGTSPTASATTQATDNDAQKSAVPASESKKDSLEALKARTLKNNAPKLEAPSQVDEEANNDSRS